MLESKSCCLWFLSFIAYAHFEAVQGQTVVAGTSFVPACNLGQLNQAYVDELNKQRKQENPKASVVRVDKELLRGAVSFNAEMEQQDRLFHDISHTHVEMVGQSAGLDNYRAAPQKLAAYIYRCFAQSRSGHCEAQSDPALCFVAISCSRHYFVVRLERMEATDAAMPRR